MKIKVERRQDKINPFGGINFAINAIKTSCIVELIEDELGKRPAQAKYSYSDIFIELWSLFFCGGDCAEDLNEHLHGHFSKIPEMKTANADTVLRVLKKLKTEKEQVISSTGNTYDINRHDKLNHLNISILLRLGLLSPGKKHDFDYDNEVLPTEKLDTKKSYQMQFGYFPGMATINGMPVYFENRDGNMNVKTGQAELLERGYKMLKDNGVEINRSRMDAGSYSRDIVETADKYSDLIYIRANKCESLTEELRDVETWEKVEINFIKYEVCSIDYQPFSYEKGETPKTYRLVVMREEIGEKQLNVFTGDSMKYRSILTTDYCSSSKEVIEYYNARGAEERTIDAMNNDFGWNRMPFSFMEENTVFLIVMMICKNIFTWLIGMFAEKLTFLKNNFRLKKFIFRFIIVPAKWVRRTLVVYSTKPYELLAT